MGSMGSWMSRKEREKELVQFKVLSARAERMAVIMVVSDPEMHDDVPIIRGTKYRVYEVAALYPSIPITEICELYPGLTPNKCYLAFIYSKMFPRRRCA